MARSTRVTAARVISVCGWNWSNRRQTKGRWGWGERRTRWNAHLWMEFGSGSKNLANLRRETKAPVAGVTFQRTASASFSHNTPHLRARMSGSSVYQARPKWASTGDTRKNGRTASITVRCGLQIPPIHLFCRSRSPREQRSATQYRAQQRIFRPLSAHYNLTGNI